MREVGGQNSTSLVDVNYGWPLPRVVVVAPLCIRFGGGTELVNKAWNSSLFFLFRRLLFIRSEFPSPLYPIYATIPFGKCNGDGCVTAVVAIDGGLKQSLKGVSTVSVALMWRTFTFPPFVCALKPNNVWGTSDISWTYIIGYETWAWLTLIK